MGLMPAINGDHLCPICKLGKKFGSKTCDNIMQHASKWSLEQNGE